MGTINPCVLETSHVEESRIFVLHDLWDNAAVYDIQICDELAGARPFPPGQYYPFELSMAMDELSPSKRSELTAMTSNATPEADAEAEAEPVATAAILDNPLHNPLADNDNNNEAAALTTPPENATDDALQQVSSEAEKMPPREDKQTERPSEVLVTVANAGDEMTEGDEERGAQMQPSLAATPALPEPDISRFVAEINALNSNPDVLAQMIQGRAYIPELMPDLGFPHDQDLQSAQHASIPHDGQVPIQDNWLTGMNAMVPGMPMPAPTMFENSLQDAAYYNSEYGQQAVADADHKVQGYAKIEFDDGHFYLNSYSLMIGRDLRLQKLQMRNGSGAQRISTTKATKSIVSDRGGFVREFDEDEYEEGHDRKRRRKDRGSSRPSKRIKKSRSSGSSSHRHSRRPSMAPPMDIPQHQYSDSERPARVDVEKHQPSPHKMVTLYIHPPYPASTSDWKAISREHLLIAFNFEKNLWEGQVKGRNGCFVEDELKSQDQVFELTNGCHLQIGAVELLFRLPEHIPIGKTGADEDEGSDDEDDSTAAGLQFDTDGDERLKYVMAGKEMSLDFQNERRQALGLDDDSDSDDYDDEDERERVDRASDEEDDGGIDIGQSQLYSDEQDSEEGVEDVVEDEEEERDGDQQEGEVEYDFEDLRPEPEPITPEPKKRGVGRPPKDGISKRQQKEMKAAQLAKEASEKESKKASKKEEKVSKEPKAPKEVKEIKEVKEGKEGKSAKKGIKADPGSQGLADTGNKTAPEGGEKRKVGRPRKHPRPDTPPEPREKRKYTKRKPKEPKEGEAKTEGEAGDDENKDSKEQKPPRSPRSPSPNFVEADLTEEQLAKPSCNYVQLIYEALSESKHKQMSLPQIYRAIQRKYPYFVCRVSTVGWQSSVRHNLGQNEGFEKVERDGKGWKWAIKEGATFEKEKKKKASPPPQYQPGHMQPIYPGYPHGYSMQGYPPQGMMVPPMGYQMHHQMPPNYRPGQPQQYMGHMGHPPHMNGLYQPGSQPPMNSQPSLTIPPALAPPASTSYSSPYGPKPAASNLPASQPSPSTAQPGSSTSQPGLPTSQSGPSSSQPGPSTSQPASLQSQPNLSTSQPDTPASQSGAQAGQPGSSTAQSGPPSQPRPSNDPLGPSSSKPGTATNRHPKESGSTDTPVSQSGHQHARQPQYPPYGQSQHFAQSFPPQQSPPQQPPQQPPTQLSQLQQKQTYPSPQPYQPQPQQPAPLQIQAQPVQQIGMGTSAPVNQKLMSAIESFRKALAIQMAAKPNGIAILDGAVRKVLGQSSDDASGHPDEAPIVEVLQNMLKKIGLLPQAGAPNSHSEQISSPPPPTPQPQTQSYQQANHSGTQAGTSQPQPPAKSTGSEKPNPTIMRPTFNQNRPSGTSIPRPPMNTMGRSNSNSTNATMRQQTPLDSPAPSANLSNGASTPLPTNEIGQIEGPKKEVVDDSLLVKSELATGPSPPPSQSAETRS
ncbi:hypothetical protein BKA65DRAFT_495052 [Rhexocercosporidium sp. MPI-PUGE-AT-0058]|nr:hypothetical protein BKA65DRAFT_495052 [Rhexocercosporidium sp. MPI-PUGE-AT-0058]